MNAWMDIILAVAVAVVIGWVVRVRTAGGAAAVAETKAPISWAQRVRLFYRLRIRQAGLRSPLAGPALWVARIGLGLLLPLLAGELGDLVDRGNLSGSLAPLLALGGFLLPDLWLWQTWKTRRRRIRRALSFFLDLVVALLHSGATVERAILRAARDGFMEPHPLADEVLLLGREMELGRDSAGGFLRLAERTGVPELSAVAAAVRIGMRSGAGTEVTLERQADLLRLRYREEGLQRINRMSVVTMIPVFLSGVPLYAVIIFFPAVLEFFSTWRIIRPE